MDQRYLYIERSCYYIDGRESNTGGCGSNLHDERSVSEGGNEHQNEGETEEESG